MELGIRFLEKNFIILYIIFTYCLCLFFIYLCICYFILFTLLHIPLPLFYNVFQTMLTSEMERLWEIDSGLYPLTVFAESFILDLCIGFEYVSCYFVLIETISLSLQWWRDKLKSNNLLPLGLSFYYFIDS